QLRQLRILLVEGDLRRSGVTRILGQEHSSGLADFLQDWARFETCVKATMLSHLHVAPAGNLTPDSVPAILEGERWPKFIERAKEEVDLIIVDSVPVSAPIADLDLLLNPCDAALLVVHVRKTARRALDISADRTQGKLLGVVVNNKQLPGRFEYE